MDATATGEFERQMVTLRPALCRSAYRLVRNAAAAEDLVQEALTRALEQRERLRPGTDLGAWARTVIHNLSMDAHRRGQRFDAPGADLDARPQPPSETLPQWHTLTMEDVRTALAECPDHLRAPFEMHYFEDASLAEIGARLQMPRGTVATRLFRARLLLKQLLGRGLATNDGVPTIIVGRTPRAAKDRSRRAIRIRPPAMVAVPIMEPRAAPIGEVPESPGRPAATLHAM